MYIYSYNKVSQRKNIKKSIRKGKYIYHIYCIVGKKYPHINEPVKLKPDLFKGQLYICTLKFYVFFYYFLIF